MRRHEWTDDEGDTWEVDRAKAPGGAHLALRYAPSLHTLSREILRLAGEVARLRANSTNGEIVRQANVILNQNEQLHRLTAEVERLKAEIERGLKAAGDDWKIGVRLHEVLCNKRENDERARIRRDLEDVVPEVPGQTERHITLTRASWLVILNHACSGKG